MAEKRKMVVKIDLGGMKEPAGLPFVVTEVPRNTLTIKEGEYFLYTTEDGEMHAGNQAGLGLYYRDTRYLSILVTTIQGAVPMLLTSSSDEDYMCYIHLCNPDIGKDGEVIVPQNCINIRKTRLIDRGLREQLHVQNFFIEPVTFTLSIRLGADFSDIFEVRGMKRPHRGKLQNPRIRGDHLVFGYRGLDDLQRTTLVGVSVKPDRIDLGRTQACLHFDMELAPYEVETIELDILPLGEGESPSVTDFAATHDRLTDSYREWMAEATSIVTDNNIFNLLLRQGMKDLRALTSRTRYGDIVVGGIPWYATPFGRDALITGFELLMVKPRIARDALNFLALFQGNEVNGWRDEEPGKIIHEIRQGEMARTRFVPHTPYYGTVDATPLFIILASEYLRWTNDLDLIRSLEGNLDAALRWMDEYGDLDGDGFIEYIRHSPGGLSNQYWKDSWDSLRFENGDIPEPPIATVETQAYAFYARHRMSELLLRLGRFSESERVAEQAEEMRLRFEDRFWDEERQYYIMALDGNKRPVRAVSSNAGHALFTGLPGQDRAAKVMERLLSPDMFSGWGIRTLGESASYYNPMSYHNGTVWPHDNAIIMRGMKRYGESEGFLTILDSLFEAAMSMQYLRLPELYCGFSRARLDYPVIYPVACQPQAWSSGAIFLIMQSMLGITADAANKVLFVNRPTLPHWLSRVELRGLYVGSERIDLLFRREADATNFSVLGKSRDMKVIMEE